jgi:chromosome segregation ATPase
MERMQAGLQQLFTKNQELEMLLKESRDEENKARKLVALLEAKVDDMQSLANQSLGSNSRAVEAAEKLAEEAVRDNEALTNEIAHLRDSITRFRNEYQSLSQKHQGVVARNVELERLLAGNDSETMANREAFAACREEKAQLEEQLASFSSKTAEMMKQRIDRVKEDYAKRQSVHQARIKQLEEQEDLRRAKVKNELSDKQSENEHLRLRIAQIEKASALKLQDTEVALARVQTELNEANDEARIQRDENATLQNELSHLRGIIDVAEQSVNEVNRLRIENDQLQESIRSQRDQQTHDNSFEVPFEIRGKSNNVSFLHDADEYFMKERVTALMRENEQNNISMRSLQVIWTQA